MSVFLAWATTPVDPETSGPWEELRPVGPDLVLVLSDHTLSVVYHNLKWSLPEQAGLIVAPLRELPKLKGLPPGTQTWLRDHL
ncbi:MAG: hypothetical protein WBP61_09820 [Nocardioides sp.]